MKPEVADLLLAAREDLSEANQLLKIELNRPAARSAYYAGFHAAEAFILDRTGKIAKTHSGVRTVFGQLVKDDLSIDRETKGFLGDA